MKRVLLFIPCLVDQRRESRRNSSGQTVVTIQLTVFGRGYSPPPRGGVDATSRKYREASFEERTGWSLTSHISECVLNTACDRPSPSAPLRRLRDIFLVAQPG